jgi:hypothetical protein
MTPKTIEYRAKQAYLTRQLWRQVFKWSIVAAAIGTFLGKWIVG